MKTARWAALSAVLALVALLVAVPGEASAATYQVTMKGYAFVPARLTVPAGSTVTWTNQDTAPHDVKTTSGPASIHSPMLDKGESWSFTFGTAGSYGYYCTVHPDMTAGITVRAAAPATSAAPTRTHTHQETSTGGQQEDHSEHAETATVGPTARAPRSHSSTPSMAMPTTTTAAAVPSASPTVAAAAPQTQPVASARPLDPLLLLTGIVAGVAVLCLLLVGSRAAAPRGRNET